MINDKPSYYNIETLAQMTGLTRRSIRYYVQRELIPKPEGGGRGHYYTDEHLRRIEIIKKWQAQGVPLEKMKELLAQGKTEYVVRESAAEYHALRSSTTQWTRVSIGPDVELSFRRGVLADQDKKEIENYISSKIKK